MLDVSVSDQQLQIIRMTSFMPCSPAHNTKYIDCQTLLQLHVSHRPFVFKHLTAFCICKRCGTYNQKKVFPLLQILEKLQADPLAQVPAAKEALTELSTLFNLLGHMQGLHHIEFNMSLARGLDYYTGVIYEAVMLKSWNGGQPQVGSVAAGGR